jgi:hypothetical protein
VNIFSPYSDTPTLKKAIGIWSKGKDIFLTLEVELMQEGYDVPALRNKYLDN